MLHYISVPFCIVNNLVAAARRKAREKLNNLFNLKLKYHTPSLAPYGVLLDEKQGLQNNENKEDFIP